MGIERDPVKAIMLVDLEESEAMEMVREMIERGLPDSDPSFTDNGKWVYAELEDRDGNIWFFEYLDSFEGEDLAFYCLNCDADPDHMIECIEEIGYGQHMGYIGHEIHTG